MTLRGEDIGRAVSAPGGIHQRMLSGPPFARQARPVADAPLAALAGDEDLAKAWLLLLLAQAPLSAAADVPTGDLAREAPGLCASMAAALASDAELDRLRPGGDRAQLAARAGALAGAIDPAGAAGAVGALRSVIWSALLEALVRPEPEQVAELAARLSLVADVVVAAALAPAAVLPVRGPSAPPRQEAEPAGETESAPPRPEHPQPPAPGPPGRVRRRARGTGVRPDPGSLRYRTSQRAQDAAEPRRGHGR